jgi:hypothetical protein
MYSLHRNTLRHDAFPRPSHDSDGYRPASHWGRPGSIDGSSTWNLWWTKWQWDRFYLRVFQFSPVSNIPAILHVHLSKLSNWQRRYINTLRFRAVSYKDRYLLLNLSIYFIYLFIIYVFINLFTYYLFIYLSIYVFILCIYVFTYSFIYLFMYLSYLFIYLCILFINYLSIYLCIYFICLFIYVFILFIYVFICVFILFIY